VSLKISSRYLKTNLRESNMTDENQNQEDVIGDLYEDENNVEEAHDTKNAEEQSVGSVKAAGNAAPSAKKRKGDKAGSDSMQKVVPGDPDKHTASVNDKGASPFKEGRMTKASMINNAYQKMNSLNKEELTNLYNKLMMENSEEADEIADTEVVQSSVNADIDWSEDLNALVESEATLSAEFKSKAGHIMEAAINSRLAEEINNLEEKYNEELATEIEETKTQMVDKVDSYLNYVVENWMEENKVAVQTGLRTEIAEKFMNNLKDLFTESYIDVPESKVDLVDNLAAEVEELGEQLNDQTGKSIAMQEELEGYKRDAIIREASKDLAETQIEKLKSLVEKVDFDDEETFANKVATIKESYFKQRANKYGEAEEIEEDTNEVETSGSMSHYVNALKSQIKT